MWLSKLGWYTENINRVVSNLGFSLSGVIQARDASFQAQPHLPIFQTATVIHLPLGLYARVTKHSHMVSDSLVISMDKISASPGSPGSACGVNPLDFIGRHNCDYFFKTDWKPSLNQNSLWAMWAHNSCELLCVQNTHAELHRLMSKQVWPSARPCPSSSPSFPIAVHVGEVTPFRTSAAGALRGKGIFSLVVHTSLQCSQLLGPGAFTPRL